MQVYLMNPEGVTEGLFNAARAARLCVGKTFVGNEADAVRYLRGLIEKGHESVIEHLVFTFQIKGISRACLQELVRHRIASYSVKSTRYTLKELLKGDVKDFIVGLDQLSPNQQELILNTLLEIKGCLAKGVPNDKAKMLLPECFATELFMTMNLRSFRNFLRLRTSKRAHAEIRELAYNMVKALPLVLYPLISDCPEASE